MQKSFGRALALLLALMMLLSLAGCSTSSPIRASARSKRVIATADGYEIAYENLYYLVNTRIAEMKAVHGENVFDDAAQRDALVAFVKENLVTRHEALLALAASYGIDHEKGDIAEQIELQMADVIDSNFNGDRDAYIESLNQAYLTDRYVRAYIAAIDYLPTAIVSEMLKRGELDDSDETALETVRGDDFIRTVHVFISKTNQLYTEEENRAHIEKIHQDVTSKTDADARYDAMRDAIGGKYNNDYGDSTGNGYYFTYLEMDQEYEQAAFGLENPYDVSDVVETDDGFYVIMRLPKDESYITQNLVTLKNQTYFVKLNDEVNNKLDKMTLEMTKFGKSLDYFDLPAIDADGGELPFVILCVGVCACSVVAILAAVWFWRRKKGKKA